VFLPSRKSRSYFDYDFLPEELREVRSHVAVWPNEPDYFYHGRTMAGAGRYLMLRAINPTPAPRLLVEMTSTFAPATQFELPPTQAVGVTATALGAVGRGSARLYSQPVIPVRVANLTVLGVDMGVDGRQNRANDSGVVIDPRWLATYLRGVSLVSEDQYRSLQPPALIERFPAGLDNKALEYSGLYEDGWMAERAFVRLAGASHPVRFVLHAMYPWKTADSGASELTIRVNGKERARSTLHHGDFSVRFELEPSPEPIRIDLIADGAKRLGPGDARPASVLIKSIGWTSDEDVPSSTVPRSLNAGEGSGLH
jgi:hypothetical protein